MNKKIKKIEITDFRAFKGKQEFDFVHDKRGEIADLVVLYAPNGYGKTSFFDAVEWTITGEIARLEQSTIKEEVNNEKMYILKNREAKGKSGIVKLIAEDDSVIEAKTKRLLRKTGKRGGDLDEWQDRKIDDELKSIEEEKDKFCTSNLLAHDKITGFFQEYTGTEKTEQLSTMWGGVRYIEILNKINELEKGIKNKKEQLDSEIKEKKKILSEYQFEENKSEEIGEKILGYKKEYDIYSIDMYENSNIYKLMEQISKENESTQKIKEQSENKLNKSEYLLKGIEEYEENKAKKKLKQQDKRLLEDLILTCEKLEKEKEQEKKTRKEIEDLEVIISNIDDFFEKKKQLSENKLRIEEIKKGESVLEKKRVEIESSVDKNQLKLKERNENNVCVQKKIVEIQNDLIEYENALIQQKKHLEIYDKVKKDLKNRQNQSEKQSEEIIKLNGFLKESRDIENIQNIVSKDIVDRYLEIKELEEKKESISRNSNILQESKKKIIELLDKLQQVNALGKEIVLEKKDGICPLCLAEYNSFEELSNRISKESNENEEVQKIEEELQKNREKKGEIEDLLKKKNAEVSESINAMLDDKNQQYLLEKEEISKSKQKIDDCENLLKKLATVIGDLQLKYAEENLNIEKKSEMESKLDDLNNQKNKGIKIIQDYTQEIKRLREEYEENINEITKMKLQKINIESKDDKIRSTGIYIKLNQFWQDKEFDKGELKNNEIRALLELEVDRLKKQEEELQKSILNYQKKVPRLKEDYEIELGVLQRELNELQVNIDTFLTSVYKVIEIKDNNEIYDEIQKKISELKAYITHLDKKIQIENEIKIGLSGLKEQTRWLEENKEIDKKSQILKQLEKTIEKLAESRRKIEEFTVEQTNKCFDSEIINQIYSRIDPHPTMKHIKFKAEIKGRGLETFIYTFDELEEKQMSPVLYLSSAQVNILSLSIFLSKVLVENKTTFNTIFMDDPIQHLDGINLLAFIDLLRTITTQMKRQIVISTHNEQFYKLLKLKMDDKYHLSKFIELEMGKVVENN